MTPILGPTRFHGFPWLLDAEYCLTRHPRQTFFFKDKTTYNLFFLDHNLFFLETIFRQRPSDSSEGEGELDIGFLHQPLKALTRGSVSREPNPSNGRLTALTKCHVFRNTVTVSVEDTNDTVE